MSEIILPSAPEDRKKIKSAIKEISNSLTRIEGEQDNIKSIKVRIKKEFGLPPAYIQKVAKVFHKQNFTEEQQKSADFEDLYETIMDTAAATDE